MKTLTLLLLGSLAALTSAGCVVVRYTNYNDDGKIKSRTTYLSPAFGVKSIGEADLNEGKLQGYKSEQTQMAEALSTGIATGLARGLGTK